MNQTKFKKRVDIWSEYRDEINNLSLKLSSPLTSDKKLVKLINSINAIDESILKNVNNDIELMHSQNFKPNFSTQYESLNFIINTLNQDLLDKIHNDVSVADSYKNDSFLIDKNGQLSKESLDKFKTQENILNKIEFDWISINNKVKNFPETSNEDLTALNKVLEDVKIKLSNKTYDNKVKTDKIELSKDYKNLYIIFAVTLIVSLVLVVITSILLII
ncbi:MAG: hypothetical protein ACRC4L_03515 [Mycoplasma sp.]